jgi:hypothetical protein
LSGRTPQAAVRNFLAPLKAVVSCITSEGFVIRGSRAAGERQTAHFQDGFAILTRRQGQTLSLELYHRYIIREAEGERGPWTASTVEYVYELGDQSGDLIAAWHWHPTTTRPDDKSQWPHLHAHGARETLALHKLHLPTGRVSIEAVVRFLIEDLDVTPQRSDWERVLEQHEQTFRQARSWS